MGADKNPRLYLGTSEGLYVAESTEGKYLPRKLNLAATGDYRAPVVVDCDDPSVLYAGTNKSGMFRSRDSGETWDAINSGLLHKTVWSITQHRDTGDLYVGASPASIFVSKDRGDTWSEHENLELLPETRDWHGPIPPYVSRMKGIALTTGINPVIYGAIEEGWAVRSMDGGETWEQICANVGPLAHDGHSIVVNDTDASVLLSTGKGMFLSTDQGLHFEAVNKGLGERTYTSCPLVTHPDRPGYILTGVTAVGPGQWRRPEGGDSGFARSEDGGRTWSVSTSGLATPCVGIPRGIAITPDDAEWSFEGLTDGTVWSSHDSGISFTQVIGGLPSIVSVTATAS